MPVDYFVSKFAESDKLAKKKIIPEQIMAIFTCSIEHKSNVEFKV